MPNKRILWFKLWIGSTRHEKVAQLDDRAFRVWVELLDGAAQQTVRGRYANVQAAAAVVRRPPALIRRLLAVGLLDERDDGLWMHDWQDWQRWRPEDAANDDPSPHDHPPNNNPSTHDRHLIDTRSPGDQHTMTNGSALDQPSRAAERAKTGDGRVETENKTPLAPSGHPPRLRVVGDPVPKPTHPPIDDEYVAKLVTEFAPQLGGEAHVRLRIDTALNHRQYTRAIDKRRYLHNWLRGDVEFARGRIASGGGAAYRRPLSDEQLEDLPF